MSLDTLQLKPYRIILVTANDVIKGRANKKKIIRVLLKKPTNNMVSLLKKSKKGTLNLAQKEPSRVQSRPNSR